MGYGKSCEHIELFKVLNGYSVRQFGRTPKAKSIKLDEVGVVFRTKQDTVGHVCVRYRKRPEGLKTVAVKLNAFIFGRKPQVGLRSKNRPTCHDAERDKIDLKNKHLFCVVFNSFIEFFGVLSDFRANLLGISLIFDQNLVSII